MAGRRYPLWRRPDDATLRAVPRRNHGLGQDTGKNLSADKT